jgi:hypothetical protein
MLDDHLYYQRLIGILFYKNKVIGYTHSIAEAEWICEKNEREYSLQFDGYKSKYLKYCCNPDNLVTLHTWLDKIPEHTV